jgi:ribonucleoside-diphosphate reductase alpha chain
MAKVWNKKIFEYIYSETNKASLDIGEERGACPDAEEVGSKERFSNKTAIAPTASISIIAGNASPGIEPFAANSFVQKTLTGSFNVRNKNLEKLLIEKGFNNDQVWSSIATHEGSVQHLTFLSDEEKEVYKTAYEIDQHWLIELASDRTPYISQSQSLNIFLPGNVSKKYLNNIHFQAWKKGVKSLYYCRSTSIQRPDKVSHSVLKADFKDIEKEHNKIAEAALNNFDECLACE